MNDDIIINTKTKAKKDGEYSLKGDYHRIIDKKWRYYPVYLAKKDYINNFMSDIPKDAKILDVGCGEGIFVETYRNRGYDIIGLDLYYASDYVYQGNITSIPFSDGEFDIIFCLDVIEHLDFKDQGTALEEVKRVLKQEGIVVFALPNLAHFLSRISFMLTGNLIRTSSIDRHKGDRPIREFLDLIHESDLYIMKRKGIFPTFPIISALTYFYPQKVYKIHSFYNSVFSYPNWCFLNIIICKKKEDSLMAEMNPCPPYWIRCKE